MTTVSIRTFLFPAALAAAALIALPAAAEGPDLSPLEVSGRAPTTVRIHLVGKTTQVVHTEIAAAARVVCRNAVRNRELNKPELSWCRQATTRRANHTYASLVRSGRLAAADGAIMLSAR